MILNLFRFGSNSRWHYIFNQQVCIERIYGLSKGRASCAKSSWVHFHYNSIHHIYQYTAGFGRFSESKAHVRYFKYFLTFVLNIFNYIFEQNSETNMVRLYTPQNVAASVVNGIELNKVYVVRPMHIMMLVQFLS